MAAYCVKCRGRRQMQSPKPVVLRNRRRATKGTCPECRTTMYRIER